MIELSKHMNVIQPFWRGGGGLEPEGHLSISYGCATQWRLAPPALGRWTDTAVRDRRKVWLLLLKWPHLLRMLPAAGPLHIATKVGDTMPRR